MTKHFLLFTLGLMLTFGVQQIQADDFTFPENTIDDIYITGEGTGTDPIIVEDGWAHYDNGTYSDAIGGGSGSGLFYWGIRIPAGSVRSSYLDKVKLVCPYSGELTFHIYEGGETPAQGILKHSQSVQVEGSQDFQEFLLNPSLAIDPNKDLWIVFKNNKGVDHPAGFSVSHNAPDARWISLNGENWRDIIYEGEDLDDIAWMIRGHFADAPAAHAWAKDLKVNATEATSVALSWSGEGNSFELRYKPLQVYTGFEDGVLAPWTTIDADGDGETWFADNYINYTGSQDAISESYKYYVGALNPDNYLVSPKVQLGGTISFWAAAGHNRDVAEHFGVAVSTTGNTDAADFTTIQEWTCEDTKAYHQYTVDLSAYEGQEGYVAIRHFNCTNQYRLMIDDIEIEQPGITIPDWTVVENITATSYTLENLAPETYYKVQVRAVKAGVPSYWSQSLFFLTEESTGIEQIVDGRSSLVDGQKILHEGHLYLLRDGKLFNAQGARVK